MQLERQKKPRSNQGQRVRSTWSISVGDNICIPNWRISTPVIYNSVGWLPMEKNKVPKWLWTLGLLTCKTVEFREPIGF